MIWATGSTLAGSAVSAAFAGQLAARFSGKSVIADAAIDPPMLAAIGAG